MLEQSATGREAKVCRLTYVDQWHVYRCDACRIFVWGLWLRCRKHELQSLKVKEINDMVLLENLFPVFIRIHSHQGLIWAVGAAGHQLTRAGKNVPTVHKNMQSRLIMLYPGEMGVPSQRDKSLTWLQLKA